MPGSSVLIRSALLIAWALPNICRVGVRYRFMVIYTKTRTEDGLKIVRKWILAGLRRDTDSWTGLSYSGGGERKRNVDFYSGAKKEKRFGNKTYK